MRSPRFLLTIFAIAAATFLHAQTPAIPQQTESDPNLPPKCGNWSLRPATVTDASLPRVLLIGDSVTNAYLEPVRKALAGKANIDAWITPTTQADKSLPKTIAAILAWQKYKVIHFNLGLHGWQPGRIPEGQYEPLTRQLVQNLRAGAPQATLIWATITPVTVKGEPDKLNPDIQPTIEQHNAMALAVMKSEHVEIDDLSALMLKNLPLAAGDMFHWKPAGVALLTELVKKSISAALFGANAAADPLDLDLRARLQPAPLTAQFSVPDYYVWCGSMVKDNAGKCHLFYSRWPHKLGFYAWATHSEIAHAVSDNPLGPYHPVDVALPPRGKEYWDGLCTHDPTVMRLGSKYYLYYMGNTAEHPLGDSPTPAEMNERRMIQRNNQRIGVAVADSPDGPWQRMDQPLISPTPGFRDALCCTDPTVTARPGGGYVMVYKGVGDKAPLPFGGPVVLLAATSDSPTGPFTKQPEPVFHKDGVAFAAEDPFIWSDGHRCWAIIKDQGGYYTDKGGKGRSLVLFESPDGLHWDLARHPFITTPEVTWADGRHEKLAQLERPQVWLENGEPAVLFCAADRTPNLSASFNLQIPLKIPEEGELRAK